MVETVVTMETNAIIGCIVIVCVLVLVTGLVLWSRRTVNHIARNGYRTARQTLKELNGGK
jgi:tetrahydromethanopterin S-methyltransferase subunit E